MQLAPPLICDQEHFDEMEQILRSVLTEAENHLDESPPDSHLHHRVTPG